MNGTNFDTDARMIHANSCRCCDALPRDVFPTEDELKAAMALDELCAEINREHDTEVEAIAASVLCRLDRLQGDNWSERVRPVRGFSLSEVLIGLAIIGVLCAVLVPKLLNPMQAASYDSCVAELEAFASDVQVLKPLGKAPTQDEVRSNVRWGSDLAFDSDQYWYVPNNSDHNKGHGNDLDGCDEENPGKSMKNRECIPMRFVIVCRHTNHKGGRYCFKVDGLPPQVVPDGDERPPLTRGLEWWEGADPKFDKWIGR